MAAARPVVACNSGGPCESIGADEECGFLCEPTPAAFSATMEKLLNPQLAESMGRAARLKVASKFSREAFGHQLVDLVQTMTDTEACIDMEPIPDGLSGKGKMI
eukprot:scaffold65273_cov46-Prasinocladus_malaysianus.AAC.1